MNAMDVVRMWPSPSLNTGEAPPTQASDVRLNSKPNSRRIASNGFAADDAPLVEEMRALIGAGTANGRWDAALAVCGRAKGGGQPASKAKRLLARYSERFGAERFGED